MTETTQEHRTPTSRVSPTEAIQGLQGQVNFLNQVIQRLAMQLGEVHAVTMRANSETVEELIEENAAKQAEQEEVQRLAELHGGGEEE